MVADDERTLEDLIDREGLDDVLEALARICREKADHVRTNWQDAVLARLWDREAGRIEVVAASVEVPC